MRIIGRIIAALLSSLTLIICIYGISNGLSFDEWIPIDITMACLLIISALIGQASLDKTKYDENQIIMPNILLPLVMFSAFLLHMTLNIWIIIDLFIVGVNVWTIFHLIKPKLK